MSAAMKPAHPVRACGYSLASVNSIRAEVLARLLDGEHMTNMDAVFDAGTTRLAAVVHVLSSEYSWPIERDKIHVSCKDGHIAAVTSYSLSKKTIEAARAEGAGQWQSWVYAARRAKRANAARARDEAAQRNRCQAGAQDESMTA